MDAAALAAEHAPILRELGEVRELSRQVLAAHRAEDGRRLHEIAELVSDLLEDLELHLRDERKAAFAAVRALREDHAQVRLLLADLRCATCGYSPPRNACATWKDLWARLAALESRLLAQLAREESFSAPSRA